MSHDREQMNVVIVGHVDHGKSTVIGRLLADTGSLPKGKLEAVKANCARNAKPFEYAFLLDALKDEQAQGITIDAARCFFKSQRRDYIIIDAPGHIEFLKNMVSGAARAQAALLVIDAHEGIQENSKRHGYMMSFLGIKNIAVCVNKMDLVGYDQAVFERIRTDYQKFLDEINITPAHYIPISAREGDNIIQASAQTPWYTGVPVLGALDSFQQKAPKHEQPFRFPLQDIYKFSSRGDDRRIFAGRVETGRIRAGEEVVFWPSGKRSKITCVEGFNLPPQDAAVAGQSTGFSLDTQIYVRPGELMVRAAERAPHVSTRFKANIFWMGKQPLVYNKTYKLKIATQHVPAVLSRIVGVLDASELSSVANKPMVDRHDVAECIIETLKPVAFDEVTSISETGRFVLVDNYEIAGGGIILAPVFEDASSITRHLKDRERNWERSSITPEKRVLSNRHKSLLVVLTGGMDTGKLAIGKALEEQLFNARRQAYFLGISNALLAGSASGTVDRTLERFGHVQQLGEIAHILTDCGQILITSISDLDAHELKTLKAYNRPSRSFIVTVGESMLDVTDVDLALQPGVPPREAAAHIAAALEPLIIPDPEFSI